MKIPFKYSLRSFAARRLTTGLTMLGITLVVFVFSAVLMMSHGLERAMVSTGEDNNIIILRKAANAEITSIIGRDQADIIATLPEIAKLPDGKPLASYETVVIINIPYIDKEGFANLTVRGVSKESPGLRPNIKLVAGRMFSFGSREVVVGSSVSKRFRGASIGETLKFGGDQWTIVGTFDAGGTGFDSEIWGDTEQLGQVFNRSAFSSITVRLQSQADTTAFRAEFQRDNRLQTLDVKPEKQFYAEQSELMVTFINVLGIIITVIFSAGAVIGAAITMYAAVANRTVEIGTLRALGFGRMGILAAFLMEAVLLAILGGAAGVALAALLQFYSVSMINFGTFSEIAFSFAMSGSIVLGSLLFALVMGVVGGFLPAVRAARLNILEALRSA